MLKKFNIGLVGLGAVLLAQAIVITIGGKNITVNKVPLSTVTFSMPGATSDANGNATLNLSIATTRRPPAGVQFDIAFPATATTITAAAGPAAIAAAKGITCNLVSPGLFRCLVTAVNLNLISNGVVAVISVAINANTQLTLQNVIASSKEGTALNVAITPGGGLVTLPVAVSALTCVAPLYDVGLPVGTFNLEPTETLPCTVTLNQSAPAGGFVVTPTVNAAVTLPATITVAAGQNSADFIITGN